MDTTDPNTGWQLPIVILPEDLRADDARELTHLDDEQRAAHRQARELLRDYAQRVLDTAEKEGRSPLTELGPPARPHDRPAQQHRRAPALAPPTGPRRGKRI